MVPACTTSMGSQLYRVYLGRWTDLMVLLFVNFVDMANLVTLDPSFDSPMANVTFKEMETAILPCSVKHLGKHQIVWTDQWSTLLTHEDRRIIDDERLSVERPFTKDWNLHIRDVKYKDQGLYNCQINTHPVKIKTVNLKVQVPSRILNNSSTDALVAREGTTVTLVCNVTGIPMPSVTWHRLVANEKGEDKKSEFCPGTTKIGINGEILLIHNASRYCDGVYECVAFNGVPPAVNKLIRVSVEFPPEVRMPNNRIGQDLGKETILDCIITANPQAVGQWKRNGEEIKTGHVGSRFRIEPYSEDEHSLNLNLRIVFVEPEDYGAYTCEASNKLGKDMDTMILYDYTSQRRLSSEPPSTPTPRDMTSLLWLIPPRQAPHLSSQHHHTPSPSFLGEERPRAITNRPGGHQPVVNDQTNARAAIISLGNGSDSFRCDVNVLRLLILIPVVFYTSWSQLLQRLPL